MKLAFLVLGMTLFSAVLLLSVLYQSERGFMLSVALQVFPVLFTRDAFMRRRWFNPLWLTWSGITFLGAGWLQKNEGLQVEAVFKSFGPGYLTMAVLALVWPKWYYGAQSEGGKGDGGSP
jgi:hypothetical protein